jgi:carboxylate-amine ligase
VDQKHTDKARYFALAEEMQAAARRMLICGMHVHVAVGDDDARLDLMNQLAYFLPHLLALSASSPFWEGRTRDSGRSARRWSAVCRGLACRLGSPVGWYPTARRYADP